MEQRKTELIEDGIIGKGPYKIIITLDSITNIYKGIAICKCNLLHNSFSGDTLEVVYMECIEWLNKNCK